MEIRKGRGFPQPLEKSLAKDARLFHSSHRPDDEDLSTIYYCRQRSLRTRMRTGEGINSKSGERGRHRPFPQTPYPARRCKNTFRKRKLCPNNLCHLKGSPHNTATNYGPQISYGPLANPNVVNSSDSSNLSLTAFDVN